jgi:hypothetical protein
MRVVERERDFFLGKYIVTLLPATHIKLDATMHAKSHHFSLLPSSLLHFIHCLLHHTSSHTTMTGETDQTSIIAGDAAASGSKATTGTKRVRLPLRLLPPTWSSRPWQRKRVPSCMSTRKRRWSWRRISVPIVPPAGCHVRRYVKLKADCPEINGC